MPSSSSLCPLPFIHALSLWSTPSLSNPQPPFLSPLFFPFFFLSLYYIQRIQIFAHYFYYQPFTEEFPHADIHELLSPDFLHQLIKGTFKNHLVEWIKAYLVAEYGQQQANKILADIDRWFV
jgi:Plavaka transposase